MIGNLVGHYEILQELGAGGMGLVFKARDERLRRFVAIKFISQQRYRSEIARARFLREAQAASALNHPNIITVFDIGQFEGAPFMVMEFVEGQSLSRLIPPRGIPLFEAHSYSIQLADALAAAHAQGLVHRDLKPGNIMISLTGRVKVLDFGLAKFLDSVDLAHTDTGAFVGTVGYVSPEQAMGRELEPRSDVFSLGIVLYEMLTGCLPFTGATSWAIINAIISGELRDVRSIHPEIPEALSSLVEQMLKKEASGRPSTAAVLAALRGIPSSELALTSSGVETKIGSLEPSYTISTRPSSGPQIKDSAVAVIPLRGLCGKQDEAQLVEALTEGIAAEFVRALSGVPGISIASPLGSLRLKEAGSNVADMARSLKIAYLVSGSLRYTGNRIRVIAQLDDTMSGLQLWCQSYDRAISDFLDVQEELAETIAGAVSGQIIRARAKHASVVPDFLADAMVLVRSAYHTLNTSYHPEAMVDAVSVLRKAIKLDPNFALAHAFLGFFLAQLVVNNLSTSVEMDRLEAFTSVQKAVRLAPGNAEVLENSGLVLMHCGYHEQAEEALRRSVEIAPVNLVAWGYLALFLGWCGESEDEVTESHAIIDRILRKAPDHPSLPYWLYFKGGVYMRQGLAKKAVELCRRSVSLQPRFPVSLIECANALGNCGRFEEAWELAGQVVAMNPRGSQESYMRELLITTGSSERAENHISGLVAAGIFKGDLLWPVVSKPSFLSAQTPST